MFSVAGRQGPAWLRCSKGMSEVNRLVVGSLWFGMAFALGVVCRGCVFGIQKEAVTV